SPRSCPTSRTCAKSSPTARPRSCAAPATPRRWLRACAASPRTARSPPRSARRAGVRWSNATGPGAGRRAACSPRTRRWPRDPRARGFPAARDRLRDRPAVGVGHLGAGGVVLLARPAPAPARRVRRVAHPGALVELAARRRPARLVAARPGPVAAPGRCGVDHRLALRGEPLPDRAGRGGGRGRGRARAPVLAAVRPPAVRGAAAPVRDRTDRVRAEGGRGHRRARAGQRARPRRRARGRAPVRSGSGRGASRRRPVRRPALAARTDHARLVLRVPARHAAPAACVDPGLVAAARARAQRRAHRVPVLRREVVGGGVREHQRARPRQRDGVDRRGRRAARARPRLLPGGRMSRVLKVSSAVLWLLAPGLLFLSWYRPFTVSVGRAERLPAEIGRFTLVEETPLTPREHMLLGTDDAVSRTYRAADGGLVFLVAVFHQHNWKS